MDVSEATTVSDGGPDVALQPAGYAARLTAWAAAYPWALPVGAALVGILARVWLVAHTHAMLDGDEAMIGLQAERILHGQFPTYFYGQAYMGTLEAYLAAPFVALLGPTGWALRLVPIVLSPLLVYLTWRLARAVLPRDATTTPLLAGLAACVAGLPHLYVVITEMRTWGGQIEVYVVTLALLLCVVELADRLRAGASTTELLRRWLVLGFVAGLGIWINPLIVYALVAAFLWLLLPLAGRVAPGRFPGATARAAAGATWGLAALAPALALLPGLLIGGLPAWLYAAQHSGENLLVYVSQPTVDLAASGAARHGRLFLGAAITVRYFTCVAPNVLDGRLPTESALLLPLRLLLLAPPVMAIAVGLWLLGRRVAGAPQLGLPLVFAGVITAIFCLGTSAWADTKACSADLAGRYAVPLGLVEPLFLIGLFALPAAWSAWQMRRGAPAPSSRGPATPWFGVVLAVLVIAGVAQGATYVTTSATQTFQSPFFHNVPGDDTQLLRYLAAHDIHAAWCNHWLGNVITYRTAEATTCADYYDEVIKGGIRRPPGTLETVAAADRPSFILVLTDPHPCLARELDALGIGYTMDVLSGSGVTVITPQRTVDPTTVVSGLGQDYSASAFKPSDCTGVAHASAPLVQAAAAR
jgi:hypothetical protein